MTDATPSERCGCCGASPAARLWTSLRDIVGTLVPQVPKRSQITEPPEPISAKRFLGLLEKSGLGHNQEIVRVHPSNETTAAGIANALIAASALTTWQCEKLFRGQYKGFFLDGYELLEPLPPRQYPLAFLGRHRVTQRMATVDILPWTLHGENSDLHALLQRLRTAATVQCEGMIPITSGDFEGGIRYLTWDYVEGLSLREAVDLLGPLSSDAAATICAQVALMLACTHAHGCFFGNINPRVILLTKDGRARLGTIGLPDAAQTFALRRLLVQEQHIERYLDPALASPAASPTIRSDLFSLGCVLFFALTGRELDRADLQQISTGTLGSLSATSAGLESICSRMAAREVNDRYESASVAANALIDWLKTHRGFGRS